MDTASHVLLGATLAGLAQLDPSLGGVPAAAITAATMLGSNAPDFDAVLRLAGKQSYIRHHRGISHSLPALLIWPTLITAVIAPAAGVAGAWPSLWLWSFIGVFFHVFLDALNTYGVQCLRPITKRWVHLDILCIFEPILFVVHAAGLLVWLGSGTGFGHDAGWGAGSGSAASSALEAASGSGLLFAGIYGFTIVYIALRAIWHRVMIRLVRASFNPSGICYVTPTFHPLRWRFVAETEDGFITGMISGRRLSVRHTHSKSDENEMVRATMGVDGVRAFLSFAQRVHVTCKEKQDGQGYEVRWSDVRFWHNSLLAFGVDVELDRDMRVVRHSLGWRKKQWRPPYF